MNENNVYGMNHPSCGETLWFSYYDIFSAEVERLNTHGFELKMHVFRKVMESSGLASYKKEYPDAWGHENKRAYWVASDWAVADGLARNESRKFFNGMTRWTLPYNKCFLSYDGLDFFEHRLVKFYQGIEDGSEVLFFDRDDLPGMADAISAGIPVVEFVGGEEFRVHYRKGHFVIERTLV